MNSITKHQTNISRRQFAKVGGIATVGTANLRIYEGNPVADQVLFQVGTNTAPARFTVDEDGDVTADGTIEATSFSVGGTAGWNGTFKTQLGKDVTVTNGIITNVI